MVVTENSEYARTIAMMRDWGQTKKYHHVLPGFNYRLEGIQGAVLRVKLRHLEAWTEARRACARRYDMRLSGDGVTLPASIADRRHVYHVYAIRVPARDQFQHALHAKGVQTGIHYPIPVHLQPAHADVGYKVGDFPETERAANEVLSLPMYAELTSSLQDQVVQAVREVASAR